MIDFTTWCLPHHGQSWSGSVPDTTTPFTLDCIKSLELMSLQADKQAFLSVGVNCLLVDLDGNPNRGDTQVAVTFSVKHSQPSIFHADVSTFQMVTIPSTRVVSTCDTSEQLGLVGMDVATPGPELLQSHIGLLLVITGPNGSPTGTEETLPMKRAKTNKTLVEQSIIDDLNLAF